MLSNQLFPMKRVKKMNRNQRVFNIALLPDEFFERRVNIAAALVGLNLFYCNFAQALDDSATLEAADEDDIVLIEKVVVTSRNREEIAQDVPIPQTVIGGKTLDRDRVWTVDDLVKKAPGLGATVPNSRRTGISLRGIGKASGNDSMEAAVGVIVDNVVLSHVGMSYQDFTDLDRIEVLRGPQGTLLGKNTTMGAISYVSRAPTFTPQAVANLSVGLNNNRAINAAISNAIIPDVLAYRASLFFDRQDGDIENVNAVGGRWHEKNRYGGRLQFLLNPSSNFSANFNFDYAESNERSNTKPVMFDPAYFRDATGSPRVTVRGGSVSNQNSSINNLTSLLQRPYFGGYQPIIGSWDKLDLNQAEPLLTENEGASAVLNWDVNGFTITSITAWRGLNFDAVNDSDQTKFSIATGGTLLDAGQFSQELRLSSIFNEQIDYQVGLFYMNNWASSTGRTRYGADAGAFYAQNGDYNVLYGPGSTAAGKSLLSASLNDIFVRELTEPETKSYAAFGQVNWHYNEKGTLTLGLRDTYEEKTNSRTRWYSSLDGSSVTNLDALGATLNATAREIASAKNIRSRTLGTGFHARKEGTPINASAPSWLINPSYKINESTMLYASAASGEKSGSVQFNADGSTNLVKPEEVFDIELGAKSILLNNSLMLNINLYRTTVSDYQQTTSILDTSRTDGSYRTVLGNIPEMRAQGVEIDAAFSATENLKFSFGGAYNDAVYTDWDTAPCPVELNVDASKVTCNNTGKQLLGAPRIIAIVGVDYKQPIASGYKAHLWANNAYRSRQNLSDTLSVYGWQESYNLTDVGIGLVGPQDKFELAFVVKNAFDTNYTTTISQYSRTNGVTYDGIGPYRWFGLMLNVKI